MRIAVPSSMLFNLKPTLVMDGVVLRGNMIRHSDMDTTVGEYFREGNQFWGHNLWVSASSGKPTVKYLAAIRKSV